MKLCVSCPELKLEMTFMGEDAVKLLEAAGKALLICREKVAASRQAFKKQVDVERLRKDLEDAGYGPEEIRRISAFYG